MDIAVKGVEFLISTSEEEKNMYSLVIDPSGFLIGRHTCEGCHKYGFKHFRILETCSCNEEAIIMLFKNFKKEQKVEHLFLKADNPDEIYRNLAEEKIC